MLLVVGVDVAGSGVDVAGCGVDVAGCLGRRC